jgi:cell division cycle 14
VLKRSAEDAFKPFKHIKFTDFRDASYGECSYKCSVNTLVIKILDCLRGLEYAIKLGWFDYKTFNINEYEHYEKVENGDLNWIVPKKFIAFSSPSQNPQDN